jgi:hypothetical protein
VIDFFRDAFQTLAFGLHMHEFTSPFTARGFISFSVVFCPRIVYLRTPFDRTTTKIFPSILAILLPFCR